MYRSLLLFLLPVSMLLVTACTAEVEGDAVGECDDGVDNDQDGNADCADDGCAVATVCAGDDDDTAGDDDDDTGDDDSAGDDDTVADDDDTVGDDDDTAGADADGDGFTAGSGDCDDSDPTVNSFAPELCDAIDHNCDGDATAGATDAGTWFADTDGDGFGATAASVVSCEAPAAHSEYSGDCDDSDARFHPGAVEEDCADPADYNCDGSTGYADVDGDGAAACEDCDDSDPALNAAAVETCDGDDNDCDGTVDEAGAAGETIWYLDGDGDGYGRALPTVLACAAPPGYVSNADDCADLEPAAYPGALEICDEFDNNCDDQVDEGAAAPPTWYADYDGDGAGNADITQSACQQPAGFVSTSGDCDDLDATSLPGGTEICDEADNNCDNDIDEGVTTTFYVDSDSDGYGDPGSPLTGCSPPIGTVANSLDCDDGSPSVHPGGIEVCDSLDNDCDSSVDNGAINAGTFYADTDDDGYGDPSSSTTACSAPTGYVATSGDCNDDPANGGAAVNPGVSEVCNDVDDDCDGQTDEADAQDVTTWYVDADDDSFGGTASTIVACDQPTGYVDNQDDCDDGDENSTNTTTDGDCDGYLAGSGSGADCNDADPTVNPGATEQNGDTVDSDCDGLDDIPVFSGQIEMPDSGTVDGYGGGYWSPLNGDGRTVVRVTLTQQCSNPELALFQHPQGDTSITGNYYIMDESGTVLASTGYNSYSGCSNCWLPHAGRLSVTMSAGVVYWLGFQNGSGGDMCCPSVYPDGTTRTVGIATFDSPRAHIPGTTNLGLPSSSQAVDWQNRWRIDCQ